MAEEHKGLGKIGFTFLIVRKEYAVEANEKSAKCDKKALIHLHLIFIIIWQIF